jgi:hypothetical protein
MSGRRKTDPRQNSGWAYRNFTTSTRKVRLKDLSSDT